MALKVIGAGFGRTGTASLKRALEQLGFGPCYHMSEVLSNGGHMDLWNAAAGGSPDWDEIFKGYASTTDFPASIYWRELADYYPDAKIILSLRDAERWFASTQETILSRRMMAILEGTAWRDMLRNTVDPLFEDNIHDHDTLIRVFDDHNAAVKAAFGPGRLLVYEAKQGWVPLCAFLGVDIPETDFPRVNSKDELQGMIAMLESDMGPAIMAGKGMPNVAREQVLGKE